MNSGEILVFDGLVPEVTRMDIYYAAQGSLFSIGWHDTFQIEQQGHAYLHSKWSEEEYRASGLLQALELSKEGRSILASLDGLTYVRCAINLSVPADVHWAHTHGKGSVVLLYYINLDWKQEWAGETLFWDEGKISFASPYTPGRIILFDARIRHAYRPQSIVAPHYRFTLSATYKSPPRES
jgi:hypothetical protein